MSHEFDKAFSEQHWQRGHNGDFGSMASNPVNPYLAREIRGLPPGTALDAGCGAGAEAFWLASAGWQVTAADISRNALATAAARVEASTFADRIAWLEVDLCTWHPDTRFDLVTSHYAHPAIPQLDFYARLAEWVNPGGTLLLVGHLHTPDLDASDPEPTEESVTPASITARLNPSAWHIETAGTETRVLARPDGQDMLLHDVIVRATRHG